jgi:hypothetical protein
MLKNSQRYRFSASDKLVSLAMICRMSENKNGNVNLPCFLSSWFTTSWLSSFARSLEEVIAVSCILVMAEENFVCRPISVILKQYKIKIY